MRSLILFLAVGLCFAANRPAFALPKFYDNLYGKAIATEMDNVMVIRASPSKISNAIEKYMHDPKYWNANAKCTATDKTPLSETWQCLPAVGTERLETRFTLGYDKPEKTRLITELTVVDPGITDDSPPQRYTKFDPKRYSNRFKTALALQGAMILRIKMWAEH